MSANPEVNQEFNLITEAEAKRERMRKRGFKYGFLDGASMLGDHWSSLREELDAASHASFRPAAPGYASPELVAARRRMAVFDYMVRHVRLQMAPPAQGGTPKPEFTDFVDAALEAVMNEIDELSDCSPENTRDLYVEAGEIGGMLYAPEEAVKHFNSHPEAPYPTIIAPSKIT